MKIFIISMFFLTSSHIFAFNTEVKGFIALDIAKLEKQESKPENVESGIGTLDLKFYANHDNLSSKIKLDLDSKEFDYKYSLFEEATVSYRPLEYLKFKFGKGVVPFHQKRYGVVESSYLDGGSILRAENSLRDQDRKLLTIITFGNRSMGFKNHLTYYGNSDTFDRDWETGELKVSNNKLQTSSNKSFDSKRQRGFANKFEFIPSRALSLYAAGLYYHNDAHPHAHKAFDTGGRFKKDNFELWWEYMYAYISTHENYQYPTLNQYERHLQVGTEVVLTDLINYMCTFGYMSVDDNTHSGNKEEDNNFKIDTGLKFKVVKRGFIVFGVMREEKRSWLNDVKLKNEKVLSVATKISFWF